MTSFLKKYFNMVNRLMPVGSQQGSSIGIDIGGNECRLVEIVKSGQSFELVGWAIEPIHQGDIRAALSKILRQAKFPSKEACTAVYGKGTLMRYISFPRMAFDDLKKSFIIEAERYFPFPSDQIYTDCFILDPGDKGKQMSVMVAAAKKELIDERIKLLTEAGVQPDFIGINAIALANAFHVFADNEEWSKEPVLALLDIGDSVSNLMILKNKLPLFMRDIFVGSQDMIKKINQSNVPDADKAGAMALGEAEIMQIIQEVRLSFDYFSTEKNQEVSQILVTGAAAALNGLMNILEKNLELKASMWDPLKHLKKSAELSSSLKKEDSFKLGVALGLALYQYD